jgi:signal transduction histidine kinase
LIHRAGGTLTVLLLLGTLAIGSYLHRRVSHPLDELTAAARRLGEGDLGVRVGGKFDDEFADLAGAFNAMATSLEAASRSLESRNEELVAALTRVRETQAELLAAEKLGAMGRMTAGLAHQLNNPLASVLGFAELLDGRLAEDHDPTATELREELVQPILLEARRTHNLIRSFLQFARHSAPGVSPVVVREALDVVVGLRSFAFQEAGLSIRIDDIPAAPVLAERQKLQEIFLNLVNNAHEAMGGTEGGVLGIRGHTEGGMLVLVFEDDGPGLESPDLVFEPFYTTKAVGQGTGLGLALVHRFVEEFGGSVQAANRSGGGAGFTLRLPMVQAQAGTSAAHTTPDQAPPPATEPVAHPARVLVVEDEPHLRNLQRRLLDRLGVEVLLAADVPEARRILEAEDLDLVLSDVKMPGETGMDLYRWLLGRRPELTDRFLFVTGDTEAPEIRELAKERPAMFIRKPFEMQEYSARVTAVLREAGSRE